MTRFRLECQTISWRRDTFSNGEYCILRRSHLPTSETKVRRGMQMCAQTTSFYLWAIENARSAGALWARETRDTSLPATENKRKIHSFNVILSYRLNCCWGDENVFRHGNCPKQKRGSTYFSMIFQQRPMFSHISGKLSQRSFEWYG